MKPSGTTPYPENDNGLLHVKLPTFDGPLDLLLHLVRKHEMDINDLQLAEITEPYLACLDQMESLNLDSAGEFLSIAATLVWIKSKNLLPPHLADDDAEPVDDEAKLMEQLREYQHIKDTASQLAGLDILGRDRFARQAGRMVGEDDTAESDAGAEIEGVSLYQLIEAFRGVLERAKPDPVLEVVPEVERIEDCIEGLLNHFKDNRTVAFRDLFDSHAGRRELVLIFIAILELVRLRAIRVTQTVPGGEIVCGATEHFAGSSTVWKETVMAALTSTPNLSPVAEGPSS